MYQPAMLLLRVLVIVLLLILIQDVRGVKESNGDQDHGSVGSGNEQSILTIDLGNYCGVYTNFSDCALDHQLGNLTSNGLINITADVMLLSIVSLVAIENVSIIGHDNPTINCDNAGGLYFDNCHNCTIIGITWEKCGNKTNSKPAIELFNSSNIIIQNCSFQDSITQAIVLSEMSGNVSINSCKFVFNNHFEGNGTAIHYISKIRHHCKFRFIIINCNFTQNGASDDNILVYISPSSDQSVEQVYFINNIFLSNRGRPIYVSCQKVIVSGIVMFEKNKVRSGGGMFITNHSNIMFKNSKVKFINNTATDYGGALYISQNSIVTFKGNSTVTINNNQARFGGALYIRDNSDVTFEGNSTVTISNNQANLNGGALFIFYNSDVTFEGNSTVTINNNQANLNGGALFIFYNSDVTFEGNSTVKISNNQVDNNGGAVYSDNSNITAKQNSTIIFTNNSAEDGGAVYASVSTLLASEYSTVTFDKNNAGQNGGAIYFNNQIKASFNDSSVVTWTSNTANNYGGAIYSKITQNTKYFNISEISGSSDDGVTGNLLYIDVPKSFNSSCLSHRIVGVNNYTLNQGTLDKNVATSPKILKFYDSVKYIGNEGAQCEEYYINNIMLGQEISIYPCLLDHYNKPAEVMQFKIIGEKNLNYSVHGLEYASISCNNAIEGISIVGAKTKALNYSIYFTSYATAREIICANLTVKLSPCHLGFKYLSKSQKCECYNYSRIVSCSGSSSIIARGYWFGHVTSTPTVTICPINYCNFTCCRTTNGYYHLSPERTNQCRQHRDGTACGNCVKGYTLPYYSSECVNTDQCTTAWTVVVVTLTVLYWIAMVTAVFVMMHYRISVGYLYAIAYYYSIVDILLNENVDFLPDGLYIFINIMYSIVELTLQFLGKLCLMRNISGIDQHFIHYIHPLAISLILVIIILAAKCSRRVSLLISRGIIHVICLLLLLSYTSVTTTSLLLLKYLKFFGINKVYSFLSPDIEYFHGRHLAYGMIALLCTIVVVVGLPLLLLLEPLLNRKINFIKIKPLLDQFQGCYKDKFRWFAAYYMICRLVIITINIVFTSNDFTGQYLFITVCAAIVLIHLMVKPYNATVLNILDGILLLFLVLTTVLLLTEFDESNSVIPVTLLLLILPLIIVGVVYLLACKGNIKEIFAKLFNRVDDHNFDNTEVAARNFDVIVDESMRQNATICAM